MALRTGITTGTCAAAAAHAAALLLAGSPAPEAVRVDLPNGSTIAVPIHRAMLHDDSAVAAVRKDAGDDPDVTDGAEVLVTVRFVEGGDITFLAGEGVGMVTKPGLQIPPNEPAINPVPREMIEAAIRSVIDKAVSVEIAIPGGQKLAEKTFNPRLGIVGGLSILGTTGIVRPYCRKALGEAIRCGLSVADACGIGTPILAPGNIGTAGARRHFVVADEQIIEVSNAWDLALEAIAGRDFRAMLVAGHPGKLAKLIDGHWNTHSNASPSAAPTVRDLLMQEFRIDLPESDTVEGLFAGLSATDRRRAGDMLANHIRQAVQDVSGIDMPVAVLLVNMAGRLLGKSGDFAPWQRTET